MENPYLRMLMKMEHDEQGVLITEVNPNYPESVILKPNDVILSIDGINIYNDGTGSFSGTVVLKADINAGYEMEFTLQNKVLVTFNDKPVEGLNSLVSMFRLYPGNYFYLILATLGIVGDGMSAYVTFDKMCRLVLRPSYLILSWKNLVKIMSLCKSMASDQDLNDGEDDDDELVLSKIDSDKKFVFKSPHRVSWGMISESSGIDLKPFADKVMERPQNIQQEKAPDDLMAEGQRIAKDEHHVSTAHESILEESDPEGKSITDAVIAEFEGDIYGLQTRDFWREARILSNLHHPNVVAFYGVVPDATGGTLATVTEFMANGSLRNVLVKKDR
ncbi:hypothetical protein C3L33_07758, partial [Rhododendron williamsianum]